MTYQDYINRAHVATCDMESDIAESVLETLVDEATWDLADEDNKKFYMLQLATKISAAEEISKSVADKLAEYDYDADDDEVRMLGIHRRQMRIGMLNGDWTGN